MDAMLPHAEEPEQFKEWLFDRLDSSFPDVTFDRNFQAVHTSYEDWNFWGTLVQSPAAQSSGYSTPAPSASSVRPPLIRPSSRDSTSRIADKVQQKVIARVSRHILRIERQYQTMQQLSTSDPLGQHHVRALQILRLQPRAGKDEPTLAALLMENPGVVNSLRGILNYGPNWFTLDDIPPLHPYDPKIASDGASRTGKVGVDTFLKFAKGAVQCCAILHERGTVHGEIRPDSFWFDSKSGNVKWINHGSGIRAFENGLQSNNWSNLSRSYGIGFKLQFVAPEQTGRLSAAPDQRTDIYSLGQVLFLMLTGTVPFYGSTAIETLQNVLSRRTPLVSSRREGLPQALTAIVSKMTQRNIDDRYHSVQGLLWDLEYVVKQFEQSLVSQDASLDDFTPASRDSNCIFRVPETQIGREKEREQILELLEKFRRKHKQLQSVYARKAREEEISPTKPPRTLSVDGVHSCSVSDRSQSNSSLQLADSSRLSDTSQVARRMSSDRRHPLERFVSPDDRSGSAELQNLLSTDIGSSVPSVFQDTPISSHGSKGTQRLSQLSHTEVMTVFGAAGLGKSTLVNSIVREARKHGLVSIAKFESESSNPFQPMIKLMASLFRTIFMESSVSNNLPELEAFIRPVWPILSSALGLPYDLLSPSLGMETEHERRHSLSYSANPADYKTSGAGRCRKATEFLRTGTASKSSRLQAMFISVLRFLARSHPIVFVLEDVESADAESIELLSSILQSKTLLTIIFTCRGREEVSPSVNRILSSRLAKFTSIELSNLSEDETAIVVSETLHRSKEYCFPLAAVAMQRTEGNPFALKTFLEECYKKKFIWFSWGEQRFEYNFEASFEYFAVPNPRQSDDFIFERLLELPPSSQSFLAFASFLGSPFRFSLVKTLMQAQVGDSTTKKKKSRTNESDLVRRSSQDAVKGLEALLSASVLNETDEDDVFEFCHSRYRVAALKFGGSKDAMSFQISKALIADTEHDEGCFYKAKYICASIKLVKTQLVDRYPYRAVLLEAAAKCTESDSNTTALHYLSNALTLLQEDPWDDDNADCSYSETLLLHIRAAEVYARSHADSASQLLETTLEHARTVFDKIPAYLLLSRIRQAKGGAVEAFQTLKQALTELGVKIPKSTWAQCDADFQELRKDMEALDPDEFGDRQTSDDNVLTASGEVLAEALSSAFWADTLNYYGLTLHFSRSTLKQGITNHSGLALAHFATLAVGRWDLVALGVKLSVMAENLFYRFEDDYATGRGLGLIAMQTGWLHRHARLLVSQCDVAMERSMNANDRNTALMNAGLGATMRIWASYDMGDIESFGIYVLELIPWDEDLRGVLLTGVTQFARAFQGKTQVDQAETLFTDATHDTENYLEWAASQSSAPSLVRSAYAQYLLPALYIFGYIDEAIQLAENVLLPSMKGFFAARVRASNMFYISMAYLSSDTGDDAVKIKYVKESLALLSKWSSASDINLMAWTSLITATLQERDQQVNAALKTYEDALDHCEVHGFIFELGIIYEHYSQLLSRRGANRLARGALTEAIAAFKRISCHGKAAQMSKKHEWLLKGTTSLNVVDAGCQTVGPVEARPSSLNVIADEMAHATINPFPTRVISPDPVAPGKTDADLTTLDLDVVDVTNILQSSQVLASTLQIDELLSKMADIMRSSAGAELAAIIIKRDVDNWAVAAVSDSSGRKYPIGESLENVNNMVGKYATMYAIRFRETVFVESTAEDERFAEVSSSSQSELEKSIWTTPILHGSEVLGAVYVENAPHSFTQRSLTVLRSLLFSVSISIANANLFKKLEKANLKNSVMIESQRQALTQAREAEARAKEAREEALENLRQKEEAAKAKSLFLANTSHELRTPLNGVIGMSELLKSSKLGPDQESYCDSIRVCADTLLQVINDILDFSKLEAGKLQLYSIPMALHETIVEVVRALSFSNREKPVETITELAFHEDLVVTSDPVRLHQVLMNILSNAYKFTSEGCVVVKGSVIEETEAEVEVQISVKDTGIGIDEVARKKLFMPFSQADSGTSREYGGTGLGLSICKAIVESAMGGKIWLESEKGVGTTVSFQITLPKVIQGRVVSSDNVPKANPMRVFTPDGERERELGHPTRDLSSLPRDQIRIAIAEDNLVNQKIAMKFVAKLGFPCEAFGDGMYCIEGLEKAKSEGNPFAIVLMDCQMPRLDGYEATRKIRQHEDPSISEVVIIAMTASAIRGDREKCLEAGMSAYLAKPVKQEMLKRMIDSYVSPREPAASIGGLLTMNGKLTEEGKEVAEGADEPGGDMPA